MKTAIPRDVATNASTRAEVYKAVDSERDYVDSFVLPERQYYQTHDRSRPDGLNHRCKPCNTVHQSEVAKKTKEKFGRTRSRGYELKHYYGITQADYDSMLGAQGGKCAICGQHPEQCLAVDHCHDSKVIRGLLCRRCNSALGLFDEDPAKLTSAIAYINRTPNDRPKLNHD